MSWLRRKWWVLLILLLLLELWHPWVWISLPVRGRVTDAKTRQPIAGAVIAGNWSLLEPLSDMPGAHLKLEEAVSDANGAFVLPGWAAVHLDWRYLPGSVPSLWVFRRGYLPARAGNGAVIARDAYPIILTSEQKVELLPAGGASLESYRSGSESIVMLFMDQFTTDHCALLKFPRLRAEVDALQADLTGRGGGQVAFIEETLQAAHCH